MKKTYIAPQTPTFCIDTQQMVAASPLLKKTDTGMKQEKMDVTTDETSGNLGRQSVWGDDDEEW